MWWSTDQCFHCCWLVLIFWSPLIQILLLRYSSDERCINIFFFVYGSYHIAVRSDCWRLRNTVLPRSSTSLASPYDRVHPWVCVMWFIPGGPMTMSTEHDTHTIDSGVHDLPRNTVLHWLFVCCIYILQHKIQRSNDFLRLLLRTTRWCSIVSAIVSPSIMSSPWPRLNLRGDEPQMPKMFPTTTRRSLTPSWEALKARRESAGKGVFYFSPWWAPIFVHPIPSIFRWPRRPRRRQ